MIYSKTCEYAIRALIYFVDHPGRTPATVKDVSQETGVPRSYVAKIFRCLVSSKILTSRRGPSGGFSLARLPGKITLMEIVRSLDDIEKSPFSNCVMGLHQCDDKNPCPLHPIWSSAKDQMLQCLTRSSITDVAGLADKFRRGPAGRSQLSKRMRGMFSL